MLSTKTFHVTVETKKIGEHPYYGKGSLQGFAIDGKQGPTIKLDWRGKYTFQFDGTTTHNHPFFFSKSPRGGVEEDSHETTLLSPKIDPMTKGSITIEPSVNFNINSKERSNLDKGICIYRLFYVCSKHPWMGGQLFLMGNAVALSNRHTLSPLTRDNYRKLKSFMIPRLPSTRIILPLSIGTLTLWRQIVPTMPLDQPTFMVQSPHAGGRFAYVGEQTGKIYEIDLFTTLRGDPFGDPDSDPETHAGMWAAYREFMDISHMIVDGGERGLLGMAFMPLDLLPSTSQDVIPFFIYVSKKDSVFTDHKGCLIRMEAIQRKEDQCLDVRYNVDEILCVHEPESNHNGGNLLFGPMDNMLYIGLGDGGPSDASEPGYRSQNLTSLHGKILRIDVSNLASGGPTTSVPPLPYQIPKDNPFAQRISSGGKYGVLYPVYARQKIISRYHQGIYSEYETVAPPDMLQTYIDEKKFPDVAGLKTPLPEIYVWGLRNPWGLSFTPMDKSWKGPHGLVVADVGENHMEEINIVPKPSRFESYNLGWPWFEGDSAHLPRKEDVIHQRTLFPWVTYAHSEWNRPDNPRIPSILGKKLFGNAVIGGYVYTGSRSPRLQGTYIFGDLSGWIVAVTPDHKTPRIVATGQVPEGHQLRAFAQFPYADEKDESIYGEVFALSHDTRNANQASIWQIQWDV